MQDTALFGPPSATLQLLLDDREEHDFPSVARLVGKLTPAQARTVPRGLPYSIARVVAHMLANMQFNLGLIQAPDPARYEHRGEFWPAVAEDEWPALVDEFLATLEALKQIARAAELDRVLYPRTAAEPAWTVGYKLACSVAKHNAYHLGQIVVLRRLLGAWDGPAGQQEGR